jgi:hypothetical protein
MTKRTFFLSFAAFLLVFACKNTPKPAQETAETAPVEISEPDANDLLQTLQGKWQSEQDAAYTLEIADTRMRHFNSGKLSGETSIEIDGTCATNACKVDSTDTSDGWCFVEKGQFDAQCHFVLRCDTARLEYRALGAANGGLAFKKIK